MAALANNTVERMNWPEIKLHMPITNNKPISISLLKSFIVEALINFEISYKRGVRQLVNRFKLKANI